MRCFFVRVFLMKSQKRDKIERAYHLGYKAGVRGKSTGLCPYSVAETRGSWMGGWRDAKNGFRSGLELEDL